MVFFFDEGNWLINVCVGEMMKKMDKVVGRIRLKFFFASRRRHTRYWRDWSSDVCSSDLL